MKKQNKADENLPSSEKKMEMEGKNSDDNGGVPDSSAKIKKSSHKQSSHEDTLFEPKTVIAPGGDLDALDIDIRPAGDGDFTDSLLEKGVDGEDDFDDKNFKIFTDDTSPRKKKEPEFEPSPVIATNGQLDSLTDNPNGAGYNKEDNADESTIFDIDTLTLLEMEASVEEEAPSETRETEPEKDKDDIKDHSGMDAPEPIADDDFPENWDPMADGDDSTLDLSPEMIVEPPEFLGEKQDQEIASPDDVKKEPQVVSENILDQDTRNIFEKGDDSRVAPFTDSGVIDIESNELFADDKTIDFARLEAERKKKTDTDDVINLDGTTLTEPEHDIELIEDDSVVELSPENVLTPESKEEKAEEESVLDPDFEAMVLSSKTDSDLKKDEFSDRDAQTIIAADISFPDKEPTPIPSSSNNQEILNLETFSEPVEEENVVSPGGEKTVFSPITSTYDNFKETDSKSEKSNLKTISILDTLEENDLSEDDDITDTIGLLDVLDAETKVISSEESELSTILEIEKIPEEDFPIDYDEKEKTSRESEIIEQVAEPEEIEEVETAFPDEVSALEPDKETIKHGSVEKDEKPEDEPLTHEKEQKIQIPEKENVTGVFLVYPDKIEEMMERVFEKVFEKRIEKILRKIIEKSIKEEIEKLGNMLNIDDLPSDDDI